MAKRGFREGLESGILGLAKGFGASQQLKRGLQTEIFKERLRRKLFPEEAELTEAKTEWYKKRKEKEPSLKAPTTKKFGKSYYQWDTETEKWDPIKIEGEKFGFDSVLTEEIIADLLSPKKSEAEFLRDFDDLKRNRKLWEDAGVDVSTVVNRIAKKGRPKQKGFRKAIGGFLKEFLR